MADTLESRILDAFLTAGKSFMLPKIPSDQMKLLLTTYTVDENTGCINVPHYWAKFLHDGRGPSPAKAPGLLVWFANPNNDPRLRGGKYPINRGQVRHLSKPEFADGVRQNQLIIKRYKERTGKFKLTSADYRQMNLYMIIAKSSPGDRSSVAANPFFSNTGGMSGFIDKANRIGQGMACEHIKNRLKESGVLNITINHTFGLLSARKGGLMNLLFSYFLP